MSFPSLLSPFDGVEGRDGKMKCTHAVRHEVTGVSHHTLDRILKGENVRRKTLAKIMKKCIPQS